ncbi:MAG: hypothetical protein ACRCX8_08845 [Sarcina sp.]
MKDIKGKFIKGLLKNVEGMVEKSTSLETDVYSPFLFGDEIEMAVDEKDEEITVIEK